MLIPEVLSKAGWARAEIVEDVPDEEEGRVLPADHWDTTDIEVTTWGDNFIVGKAADGMLIALFRLRDQ